ncbi:hypothetical protein ACFV0Z_18440 [Streptomyces xiamenensis]|uniref:hypothetical protein n=1 Tax=Streptomyces xiamenensis TaxID=408015 RepID=UPI0036C566FE
MKRRSFITGTLAVAGTGSSTEFAEVQEGTDAAQHGSDAADIASLESVFEWNAGGYHGRDPQAVLSSVRKDLQLLRDVPERPHTARDRATLAGTAAGSPPWSRSPTTTMATRKAHGTGSPQQFVPPPSPATTG